LSGNLRAPTSWNPRDLSRPVYGYLYLFNKYSGDEMKKDEMGGERDTYDGRREMLTLFWRGNLKDLGVGGMIILT
jgi:hypothetical protein